ncbi:decaprenylphospho-beta-D-erythro-pentofuranosid-2-ulose 2-reductase [Geodermatophilus amargosae]|uniref:Decaprenylphospho-beta-D-erythro-pentofuranosid-2-ulose 2-reductase n=1 Tax=Geodermatophilus amargosae TaxID=1296565 RepID=A0A1I7CXT1_9ACTN|nr:decaprenylphospho-beta-D-erythro-pentofuranosid-2-ulose 2-reductase [Geodermatophilus amargosae]SFU04241.1 decaprenylphospho-beta-D-erythro-pentofuranosid-2-ulose 2-reductase [Geodermatophilus amargosae]
MIDAVGDVQKVLLLGGTSEIGMALLRRLAGERRITAVLAGRPTPGLDDAAGALRSEGHQVEVVHFDAEDGGTWAPVMGKGFASGDVDVVVVAFGLLGDAERAWQEPDVAARLATVNYTAPVTMGVDAAGRLRAQGHGALIVLSSVAGERPRRTNFAYGSAKAGLDAFFTGLREALRPDGIRVVVVRPGFVRTKMTAGLDAAPLAVDAGQVAEASVSALLSGKETVWVPAPMRYVMSVLRHLPATVFRRLPI